jgi:hypothetical protein
MTQFFGILFQRLLSTDWKTAGAEIGVALTMVTAITLDVKNKDFGSLLNDIPAFWTPVALLIVTFRQIISSNDKAIKNPALPQIEGVLSTAPTPIVPTSTTSVKKSI